MIHVSSVFERSDGVVQKTAVVRIVLDYQCSFSSQVFFLKTDREQCAKRRELSSLVVLFRNHTTSSKKKIIAHGVTCNTNLS